MNDRLYTAFEVAERLDITPNAVRRLIRGRLLRGFNLRGSAGWRIPVASLRSYQRSQAPRALRASA